MRRFLISLQFLTRLPIKIKPYPTVEEIGRSMVWFPVSGLCIGLILASLNYLFSAMFAPLLTNSLLVFALIMLTGAMHLDGLADMVDGFYAGNSVAPEGRKEKILSVMKDSRIGAMGTIAIALTLILKIAALESIPSGIKIKILLITPILSRWAMVWAAAFSDYAVKRSNLPENFIGLGETFTHFNNSKTLLLSSISPCILVLFFLKLKGIFILISNIVIILSLIKYIKSKISGMTGDTFGAINEIMEVFTLLMISSIL